jgi:hypothetical protein
VRCDPHSLTLLVGHLLKSRENLVGKTGGDVQLDEISVSMKKVWIAWSLDLLQLIFRRFWITISARTNSDQNVFFVLVNPTLWCSSEPDGRCGVLQKRKKHAALPSFDGKLTGRRQ